MQSAHTGTRGGKGKEQKRYSLSRAGPHGLRGSASRRVREAAGQGALGREQSLLSAVKSLAGEGHVCMHTQARAHAHTSTHACMHSAPPSPGAGGERPRELRSPPACCSQQIPKQSTPGGAGSAAGHGLPSHPRGQDAGDAPEQNAPGTPPAPSSSAALRCFPGPVAAGTSPHSPELPPSAPRGCAGGSEAVGINSFRPPMC